MPFEIKRLNIANIKGKAVMWDDRIARFSTHKDTKNTLSKIKKKNSIHIRIPEYSGVEENEYTEAIREGYKDGLNEALRKKMNTICIPVTRNKLNDGIIWRELVALEKVVLEHLEKNICNIEILIENDCEDLLEESLAKDILDYILKNFDIDRKIIDTDTSPNLMEICTMYGASDLIIPKKTVGKNLGSAVIQEELFSTIKKARLTDLEFYARTGFEKEIFTKGETNQNNTLRRDELIGLVVGLKMPSEEGRQLLRKGGYNLEINLKADLILAYFIDREIGSLYLLQLALVQYGEVKK